jgi:DMSO/TMAO reductase YedYZ molybdopterin-dependent catalytic subunit
MPRSDPDRRAFLAMTARWTGVLVAGGLAQFAAACAPRSVTEAPPAETTPSTPGTAAPPGAGEPVQQKPQLDPVTSPPENSIAGPQHLSGRQWRMRVLGLVEKPLTLSYAEVLALKPVVERVQQMDCVEGFSVNLRRQGILVRDLLSGAGVKAGARTVIFRCHDGYSTSFPIEYFERGDAMLVYAQNGKPLIAERGYPLELAASGKWGYKWAKWIEVVEVSADASYRGYWESRGYSNSGDRDKSFIGP